jgi:hypothetical protein
VPSLSILPLSRGYTVFPVSEVVDQESLSGPLDHLISSHRITSRIKCNPSSNKTMMNCEENLLPGLTQTFSLMCGSDCCVTRRYRRYGRAPHGTYVKLKNVLGKCLFFTNKIVLFISELRLFEVQSYFERSFVYNSIRENSKWIPIHKETPSCFCHITLMWARLVARHTCVSSRSCLRVHMRLNVTSVVCILLFSILQRSTFQKPTFISCFI